jgi:hypothetical protein
MKSKLPVYA